MAQQFMLPDLGEGLTEAAIVSWLVAPGDIIAIDQPVVEVESAKSIVELPSPFAGRVVSLDAVVGGSVERGQSLLTIAALDEVSGPPQVAPRATDAATSAASSGAVLVGYGTTESAARVRRSGGSRFGGSTLGAKIAEHDGVASTPAPLLDPTRRSPVVSPLVRRQAKENGFDAAQLLGSGADALVRRDDVEQAIARRAVPATDTRTAMTAMQKLVSERLTESRRVIPEATIWLDVDATRLVRAKNRLQLVTGERFSITTLIARFTILGLKQFPILNSSVDAASREIVQHHAINLGIAAQTPRGLMVPVVHEAGSLTMRELGTRIGELVETSRTGNFTPAALNGGTFTLNNYGGFGVDGSTPIINYPEVAMLGVGRIFERPWAVAGKLSVRKVATLSFVFDHRVCDGAQASGFLRYVARCIEEPLLLLSDS